MKLEYLLYDNNKVALGIAKEKNNFIARYTPTPLSDFFMEGSALEQQVLVKYGYRSRNAYVSYSAVIYVRQKISIFPIQPNHDVLSFAFTGCCMAVFDFRNIKYAAHIALDGNPKVKKYWNLLVTSGLIQNCILFDPTDPFRSFDATYWGLITDSNYCYTVRTSEVCRRTYDRATNRYSEQSTMGNESVYLVWHRSPRSGANAIIK